MRVWEAHEGGAMLSRRAALATAAAFAITVLTGTGAPVFEFGDDAG